MYFNLTRHTGDQTNKQQEELRLHGTPLEIENQKRDRLGSIKRSQIYKEFICHVFPLILGGNIG